MSFLETLREDVDHRLEEAYGILSYLYTDDQINELLKIFLIIPIESMEDQFFKENDQVTYYGILSFLHYANLFHKLNKIKVNDALEAECMANITLGAIYALSCLIKAGYGPLESSAETQLRMRENQKGAPRNRKSKERDDIELAMEDYQIGHGHLPKNIQIFLNHLEGMPEYTIEQADGLEGTIAHREWLEPKSLGTLKRKWYYEIKKKLSADDQE